MSASQNEMELYFSILPSQWPILYTPEYNITFWGLEKLHPFDSSKWARVYKFLEEAAMLNDDNVIQPREAQLQDLMMVHPATYLNKLKWSAYVATITEVPPVALLPNCFVQKRILRPFRFQVGGTVLAGKVAIERGWAINIGGGFHHCSSKQGGGFCAYADITLSIRFVFEKLEGIAKIMIVDLDAHQGNGHERDFMKDERVYIVDVYNKGIYPKDDFAKRAIKRKVELHHRTEDEEYLFKVNSHLESALKDFHPDLIVYNAGTDILEGDPLGLLSISSEGIIKRDEIVFEKAKQRKIPIFMVTSGGYQRQTAHIIADSILNLWRKRLIGIDHH